MMIAVCTLGCDRKAAEGVPSWPYLFQLQGDYSLYFNYEYNDWNANLWFAADEFISKISKQCGKTYCFDMWKWTTWRGNWRNLPKFDQDQARLASIVTARNMCIEYAMQTEASHLLFVDADIIPPLDIIPKLLEVNEDAVAGLVYGRGAHKACPYVFGEKRHFQMVDSNNRPFMVKEAEHANIGFTMISRKLFEATRFRWGTSHYPDGRVNMTSDDPAFHLDSYLKWGKWMFIRMDVEGRHIGDLKNDEVSQF
jgi:hypothetical protein